MSGLIFAVRRDGRQPDLDDARRMAAEAPHRARAGARERTLEGAVAIHLDGGQERIAPTSPVTDRGGRRLVVADARLDNRRELATTLGRPDLAEARDDATLLLQAVDRWGDEAPTHLLGDFAFVAWDAARGHLLAARDPMGMRPLFYRAEPARLLLASEVSQLLAVPGVPSAVNERALMAHLAGNAGQGWTAYEGIRRLPAGHRLVLDTSGVRVERFWQPVVGEGRARRPEEYAEQLRDTLTQAVADRLDGSTGAGLLLSGGLDSISIAALAGTLLRDGAPPMRTYTFTYDELPECDERTVSHAVASAAGLPNTWLPCDDSWPLADYPDLGTDRDGPDLFRSYVSMHGAAARALDDGVGVLMTGQHGDQLVGSGVTDYLGRLRADGPLAAWRDLAAHSARTGLSRRVVFEHYVLRRLPGAVWPDDRLPAVRRRLRSMLDGGAPPLPPWLRADAAREHRLPEVIGRSALRSTLPGEARRVRHEIVGDHQIARNSETLERRFARHGLRHADPWSDRRLVESVLAMPQHILTPAGEAKWLAREAMRGVLPESARVAASKATPAPHYDRGILDRGSATVRSLLDGSRAAARGYVDEQALHEWYDRMVAREPAATAHIGAFWRFLTLEDWLRRYHD
ncbi:MAG: hypothetical protein GEU80_11900 [Dehalococcoidia bacterium]|nr:hypothetical protein [Dehalococcoidia bacterium]